MLFRSIGIELGRSTMCNWAMKVAGACDILVGMMADNILNGTMMNIDETTLQVLKGPRKSKSYMWIFKGGEPDKPIILFQYHPTRSGDVVSAFLKQYKGIIQTDGYAGYNFLDTKKGILHVGCWVHARRKFKEVTKAAGNNKNKSGNAGAALKYISKLYKIEKDARMEKLTPDELYIQRQAKTIPILDEFKKWLDARVEKRSEERRVGKECSEPGRIGGAAEQ